MNKLEELVTMLPSKYDEVLEDCHFSDAYCDSLDVVGDYILELEGENVELKSFVSGLMKAAEELGFNNLQHDTKTNTYKFTKEG